MRVSSATRRTQIIQEIARFLNDNLQLVQAANKVISDIAEEDNNVLSAHAVVTDNQNIQHAINKAKRFTVNTGSVRRWDMVLPQRWQGKYSIISWFERLMQIWKLNVV